MRICRCKCFKVSPTGGRLEGACTMVQWYTQKIIPSKSRQPKIIFNCKSANYKTVQAISDTFRIIKTPKNAIFGPKNASKNTLFASFFIKNGSKTRIFHQKKGLKLPFFFVFRPKVHHYETAISLRRNKIVLSAIDLCCLRPIQSPSPQIAF